MRRLLFRKLLRRLERHTPRWLASLEIQILLNTTARGFGVRGKRVWNRSPQNALAEYGSFTRACMQSMEVDSDRLYAEALRTGRRVRRITGFRASEDVTSLVFYLYRNIGIDMRGRIPGELVVRRCWFSNLYTPDNCRVMSAVDAGIIAGMAGGGSLRFQQRLTEGSCMCKALYRKGEWKDA